MALGEVSSEQPRANTQPLHNLSCADQAVSIYIKLRGKQKTIKLFLSSFSKAPAVRVSANRFKSLYKLCTVTIGDLWK